MQSNQRPKHSLITEDKTEEAIFKGTLRANDVLTIIAKKIELVTTVTNKNISLEIVEHH